MVASDVPSSDQEPGVPEEKTADNGNTQLPRNSEVKTSVRGSVQRSKASDVRPSLQHPRVSSLASTTSKNVVDSEHTRRIIAEDLTWSLQLVPLLKDLCLCHIINNFAHKPILNELLPNDKAIILEKLSTDTPLEVTADLIDDENYWKRCCKSRWEVCDVSIYGNSWKRLFFERHLESLIENYIPLKSDNFLMQKAIALCAKYVKRLIIKQFLPPIKDPPSADEEAVSDYGSDTSITKLAMDHFEFAELSHSLQHLEELRVKYGVRGCGMNFEWSLFNFTLRDCAILGLYVKTCKNLKCICIQESKVDDERARSLMKNFLDHPSLQEVILSHNCIRNRGARAVAKLINNRCPNLVKVDLYDNEIGPAGAKAIAYALKKNRQLEELNLRLNRIGNEGGEAICCALIGNISLRSINLACNDFGEPTAAVICRMLQCNTALRSLVINGNRIGKDGGKQLQIGMEQNKTLIELDIRLTDAGRDSEYFINEKLTENQEKQNVK